MPPLQSKNFTRITTTNIIDVSKPGRRTRLPRSADTNAPSRAQVSTSNILDAPNAPRRTRRGTVPASLAVRTPSTRHETRDDPLTRKDRAARQQRTKGGRFAKTKPKPKRKAKATKTQQRDIQNGEDTQDDEDPLSLMDDNQSKQASAKTLGESDGNRNATRTTAYEGPTSQEMLKALHESIADAATDTGTNGPAQHGEDMETANAGDNTTTASTRPPHRASTPASNTDADDNNDDDDNNNEPSTRRGGRNQMTTSRPTPSPEPAAPPTSSPPTSEQILTYPNGLNMPPLITYKNATPPPPRRRSPSPARFPPPPFNRDSPVPLSRTTDPFPRFPLVSTKATLPARALVVDPPSQSQSRPPRRRPSPAWFPPPPLDPFNRIRPAPSSRITNPNPHLPLPPTAVRPSLGVESPSQSQSRRARRSPSPAGLPPRSENPIVRIPPAPSSSHTTNPLPPLPLPPTPARPGLRVESPSRSQSPPSSPVEKWNHQPKGFGSLVPREGGYRGGSIERWPNLPDRMVERMRKGGWEVRGEEIVGVGRAAEEGEGEGEEEEGEKGEASGDGDGDGDGDGGADDGGLERGGEGEGVGGLEKGSEVSSVGDPADTTMLELEGLFEGY